MTASQTSFLPFFAIIIGVIRIAVLVKSRVKIIWIFNLFSLIVTWGIIVSAVAVELKKIGLKLVDFKLEFGYDCKNKILLGDEISPDNCRLWDFNKENGTIVSLDKDRFRNDLGDLIEAYAEINRRINDSTEFNP